MSKENKEKQEKVIKIKLKKKRDYSYINVIDEFLDKYSDTYTKLTEHREGCLSSEVYDLMNLMLVEDFNASINNLNNQSKKSMKYLKKKNSKENSKIFWYKFKRFFGFKKNEEIEDLILRKEKYKLEFAYLFEDIISSKIRHLVDDPLELSSDNELEEEPDYTSDPEKLFKGPKENRPLYPEVVEKKSLDHEIAEQLEYDINNDY